MSVGATGSQPVGGLKAAATLQFAAMIRRLFILIVLFAVPVFAQIPTPDEYLGYKLGDRFTPYSELVARGRA